jgi:hypothetical protein
MRMSSNDSPVGELTLFIAAPIKRDRQVSHTLAGGVGHCRRDANNINPLSPTAARGQAPNGVAIAGRRMELSHGSALGHQQVDQHHAVTPTVVMATELLTDGLQWAM